MKGIKKRIDILFWSLLILSCSKQPQIEFLNNSKVEDCLSKTIEFLRAIKQNSKNISMEYIEDKSGTKYLKIQTEYSIDNELLYSDKFEGYEIVVYKTKQNSQCPFFKTKYKEKSVPKKIYSEIFENRGYIFRYNDITGNFNIVSVIGHLVPSEVSRMNPELIPPEVIPRSAVPS